MPKVVQPRVFRTVCVEMSISHLAIAALLTLDVDCGLAGVNVGGSGGDSTLQQMNVGGIGDDGNAATTSENSKKRSLGAMLRPSIKRCFC